MKYDLETFVENDRIFLSTYGKRGTRFSTGWDNPTSWAQVNNMEAAVRFMTTSTIPQNYVLLKEYT